MVTLISVVGLSSGSLQPVTAKANKVAMSKSLDVFFVLV